MQSPARLLAALALIALTLIPLRASAQQAIYLVRHAEQVQSADDPPLTEAGQQRARALASFLRDAGITAVYSSQAQRTRQTAQPMAGALGVQVQQVPRENTAELIARVRKEEPRGRVLVVGHSETVPQILKALGHPEELTIDRTDYDNVFVVVPNGTAPPTVLRQRFRPTVSGIFGAALEEESAKTLNLSTEEMGKVLRDGSAVVLDTRPRMEWAVSHIPGALNVAPKPGMPMHRYTSDVAEVERLVEGDKSKPLILYCNGPFCGKSKRLSDELLGAGFQNVRRYQLGAPVWRALGGVMVIEPEGARHVFQRDRTAVWIDAREAAAFRAGSLPRAVNIPRSKVLPGKDQGEVKAAKDDGRLPMEDHNTRIIVFGSDAQQARAVAEAVAREAFHNVSVFGGDVSALRAAIRS